VERAASSITASEGQNLEVEMTSMAIINWLNIDRPKFSENIELGMGFLMSKINGGKFGST